MFVRKEKMFITPLSRQIVSIVCVLLIIFSIPQTSMAQAWKPGRSSLMKNDFKSAKTQLSRALKTAKPGSERAETYKYLGVAQYMSGDRNGAVASFKMAKANNPRIKLTAAEVIDESVIPVFNSARATSSGGVPQNRPNKIASGQSAKAPAVTRQKSKRTLLKVISNTQTASISIDGITYGTAGQEIEVQPGTVILEVSAAGFKPKAIKVQLRPLTSSVVTVNLDRIVKPKPKPSVAARNIPLPNTGIPMPGAQQAKTKRPGGKGDLFGDDPMAYQPYAPIPQAQAPGTYVTPPPAPTQPVQPMQGYGQAPGMYQPMPQYSPPPMAASPYPVYPQYAPPMQPYGMPYYPPAPYGGYMAPPNPYAYAPPPPVAPYGGPPAAADPYGGYLGPPIESSADSGSPPLADGPLSSDDGMPPAPIVASNPKSTAKAAAPVDNCGAIRLLPFGAGQFCNGSTLKGVVFLGGEVAALYFYRSNAAAAEAYQKKLNAILAQRAIDKEPLTEPDEIQAFDNETQKKKDQGTAAIEKAKQNSQYSLVSFVGLWGLGVLDAYINKPKPKTKKGGNRPRINYSMDLDLDVAPLGTWAVTMPQTLGSEQNMIEADYLFGYTPMRDPQSDELRHSLTLGVKLQL
jgi:hypothetical protein